MPKIISDIWWNCFWDGLHVSVGLKTKNTEYHLAFLDGSESMCEFCCTDSVGLCWGLYGRLFTPTLNALNDLSYI